MKKNKIAILSLILVTFANILIIHFRHTNLLIVNKKLPPIKIVFTKPKTPIKPKLPSLKPLKSLIPDKALTIIIDDIGRSFKQALNIWSINDNITLSIIPYLKDSSKISEYAERNNLPVMLHMPMEPFKKLKSYSHFLTTYQEDKKFLKVLSLNLKLIPYYQGINNHMGSKLTSNKRYMELFFQNIDKDKIFFIDSVTSSKSVAAVISLKYNFKTGIRDYFIDNIQDVNYIIAQLRKAEQKALHNKYAIAIGHPHKATITALTLFFDNKSIPVIRANEGIVWFKDIETKNIKNRERILDEDSYYRHRN